RRVGDVPVGGGLDEPRDDHLAALEVDEVGAEVGPLARHSPLAGQPAVGDEEDLAALRRSGLVVAARLNDGAGLGEVALACRDVDVAGVAGAAGGVDQRAVLGAVGSRAPLPIDAA